MVIAWTKQVGAKYYFRHESQMGHAIGYFTTVAYMHRQHMGQKNNVVYGLLFLLHDLADRRFLRTLLENPPTNQNLFLKLVY